MIITETAIHQTSRKELDKMFSSSGSNISLDEINQMNIMIDKSACDDSFFESIIEQFKKDGFQFTTTQNENDINRNNATIITIDQQDSNSNHISIIAPYDNTRVGQSDSLALSMQTAFYQNDFTNITITCGNKGQYRDEDGNIHYSSPTNTENSVNEGYDSSFVTLSFSQEEQDIERIAKSIENGLARQCFYLQGDNQTDLIYRANSSDSIETVAGYFGTDLNRLKHYNHISDSSFQEAQTIINPAVEEMPAFDKNVVFEIETNKKSYNM